MPQIFRVDVDKLLNDVYDKSANTLNFDRLFEILSAKISSETARHSNLLEALLDISVFEEHKDFFEALYIENLITSRDLLKLFIDSTESCQNLFVYHHKELVPALLKEYSNCCFAKEDTEIQWSLEEFCDKLEYYATHDIEKNSLKSLVLRLNSKKIHDEDMQELLAYIKKFKRLSIFENLFDKQQLLELASIFVDNEVAQNKLIQIVDNNLEQHYDFDSLTDYLKKNEKKNVMNI